MGVKNSITLRRVYIEGDIDINIFLMKKGVLFIELECYFLWKLDGWNVVVEYAYSVSDICFVSPGLVLGEKIRSAREIQAICQQVCCAGEP
jgi:hypothetical protein